jgi:hypothetical protein
MRKPAISNKILFVALMACFVVCVVLLIYPVRVFIVGITEEFLVKRVLADHNMWLRLLLRLSVSGIVVFGIAILVCLFVDYPRYITKKKNNIVGMDYKKILMPILCMFGLYALGITSIIRANFLYIDDLGRAIYGYLGWETFSRYIAEFLAIFIHADILITDISPLPQLLAAFIMAAASVFLVYIVCGKRIPKLALAASIAAGLSPYFLECFSYKFDAPYMALSVLVCVVPFVFLEDRLVFVVCSVIALLTMCMTYQASSGIYILVVILLCFKDWNYKLKTKKEILCFLGISVAAYCGSMIVFRIFLMRSVDDYVSTSMYSLQNIFSGFWHNFLIYVKLINADFGIFWKFYLVLIFIAFIAKTATQTKRNKIIAVFCSIAVLVIMCVMSFGVYLILTNPLYEPRGMYGFGIFIALLGIFIADSSSRLFAFPVVALSWCFLVFSFAYGNALADQKRYTDFRTEMLLHDLSVLFTDKTKESIPIRIHNTAGYAPSIENISMRNPVIKRLVPRNLGTDWAWGNIYLMAYYHFGLKHDASIEDTGLETIFDSYYHTIKSDGNRILVILK